MTGLRSHKSLIAHFACLFIGCEVSIHVDQSMKVFQHGCFSVFKTSRVGDNKALNSCGSLITPVGNKFCSDVIMR